MSRRNNPSAARKHQADIKTFEARDDWMRRMLSADNINPSAKVLLARLALYPSMSIPAC
jgi:hypothetical protein